MNRVNTIQIAALIKGQERYVFLFAESRRDDLLNIVERFASNPQLSLTWCDAAALNKRLRGETL